MSNETTQKTKLEYNPNAVLKEVIQKNTIRDVAVSLNVAVGTVKRWIELDRVPKQYLFELLKLNGTNIDYSRFTSKEKDQFFTPIPTAEKCFDILKSVLTKYNENYDEYVYIEPSAGSGNFLSVLPEGSIGIDIEPRSTDIIEQDFLSWNVGDDSKKYIVIGNPPFGLRGQMALKFINHAGKFADYVCFILPQLFESDGKGVPRKRVENLNLIYSEKISSNFTEPDGKSVTVNCIYQIWSKYHTNPTYTLKEHRHQDVVVYSLSDGGTPSTTRNKKMFYKCHRYIPSTCFGKENMRCYDNFDVLPRRKGYGIYFNNKVEEYKKLCDTIQWSDIAFLSTNSAYNIRTSQILTVFT